MNIATIIQAAISLLTSLWSWIVSATNTQAGGAFWGAVFTFIFAILTYRYTKRHEKWVTHRQATVLTEHLVNRHLNGIYDNMHLLEGSIATLKKTGGFTYNQLQPLQMPELAIDFHNLELINRYMNYEAEITKLNHDMETLNRATQKLWDVKLTGKQSEEDEKVSREHLIMQMQTIHKFMKMTVEETFTLGAYVRVFMRKDKFPLSSRLSRTANIKVTDAELQKEKERFKGESDDTKEESRKKISELTSTEID